MASTDYDFKTANQRVEDMFKALEGGDPESTMLPAHWYQAYIDGTVKANCVPFGSPTSYRLLDAANAEDGSEITFRLIGIVDDVSLPPFLHRFTRPSTIAYLQQKVSITASDSDSYARNIQAVVDILDLVSSLAPFPVDTHACITNINRPITFSNRMFSPIDQTQPQVAVPITHIMDPLRDLRTAARQKDLVRTDDNSVQHLHYRPGLGYQTTSPRSFRRGDIVEVHFSPVLFHADREQLFAKLVLRSIVSMDNSLSHACRARAIAEPAVQAHSSQKLKRKRIPEAGTITRRVLADITNLSTQQVSGGDVEMAENVRRVQNGIDDLELSGN